MNAPSNLEEIEEDMKGMIKTILEKYLSCRTFNQENVKNWGENIMSEIHQTISEIYPQFGYGIFFYMSEKTAYVSNHRAIYYNKTDLMLLVSYKTEDFNSEIRLIACKKRESQQNFFNNLYNQDFYININNKLADYLSGRIFDFEKFSEIIDDILEKVNKMLLDKENYPSSFLTGYINKQPEYGVCFHHKFFDLKFSPVTLEYSNSSFICRLFLFLINN